MFRHQQISGELVRVELMEVVSVASLVNECEVDLTLVAALDKVSEFVRDREALTPWAVGEVNLNRRGFVGS